MTQRSSASPAVGFIFARGGSKGVPGKNLRPLGGRPLIVHAIEAARRSQSIRQLIVSTDDQRIADIARQHGAEVPFLRPAELARDESPEWLAWQHAVRFYQTHIDPNGLDVFVSVPPTSPLRDAEDIDRCVKLYLDGRFDVVITVTPARRSPYFNMVSVDQHQAARRAVSPPSQLARRQDCPQLYDMTTVAYVANPHFILRAESIFGGRVGAVVIPADRAWDIDTELDFEIAEFLLARSQHPSLPVPRRSAG